MTINRNIQNILTILSIAFILMSCESNDSYVYNKDNKINFVTDSLYISLGNEPFNVTDTVININVEIIGFPLSEDRDFIVYIDNDSSTATMGDNYEILVDKYIMSSDKSSSTIPIKLYRRSLDDTSDYTIKLCVKGNDNFALGIVEFIDMTICFNNRLDKPDWWNELSYWLGEYDASKYQKFIEIYGVIKSDDVKKKKYEILRSFKKVRVFFEENTEYGVVFPSVDWPI